MASANHSTAATNAADSADLSRVMSSESVTAPMLTSPPRSVMSCTSDTAAVLLWRLQSAAVEQYGVPSLQHPQSLNSLLVEQLPFAQLAVHPLAFAEALLAAVTAAMPTANANTTLTKCL